MDDEAKAKRDDKLGRMAVWTYFAGQALAGLTASTYRARDTSKAAATLADEMQAEFERRFA